MDDVRKQLDLPPLVAPSPPDERGASRDKPARREQPTAADKALAPLLPQLQSGLVSLIVHLVLLIALGLWIIATERRPSPMLLDGMFDRGFDSPENSDALQMPLLVEGLPDAQPQVVEIKTEELPVEVPALQVDAPAVAAALATNADAPDLPRQVDVGHGRGILGGRDPRRRGALARQGGGNEQSELAVDLGLEWLAHHQDYSGGWTLHAFDLVPECNGSCRHTGHVSDTAATGLALLPFLGAGETHQTGRYRDVVQRGLDWLEQHQAKNGDWSGPGVGRMYAHAQATLAMCEAYAMTQDTRLAPAAQRGVDFLVKAQHRRGGWRYEPGQAGDMSVTGWVLMALRSAKLGGLTVADHNFRRAENFLDSVQSNSLGSHYGYLPGSGPTRVMTAEALLCRQYAGWKPERPAMKAGLDDLLDHHPPAAETADIYYWYYGTQVMHHAGGERWRRWNYLMRELLVNSQAEAGHERGSWAPVGPFSSTGGRLYMTALSICTLEVYYRHLPLFREQAVAGDHLAAEPHLPRGIRPHTQVGIESEEGEDLTR